MGLKININGIVKALAWVAFVFSVVMLPPSSSHADHAAMMQANHATIDHASMGHALAHADVSNTADGQNEGHIPADGASFGCCSGICVSVILIENEPFCAQQTVASSFALVQTQARSVVKTGALRPPRTTV